jgi:hypothetical protein
MALEIWRKWRKSGIDPFGRYGQPELRLCGLNRSVPLGGCRTENLNDTPICTPRFTVAHHNIRTRHLPPVLILLWSRCLLVGGVGVALWYAFQCAIGYAQIRLHWFFPSRCIPA